MSALPTSQPTPSADLGIAVVAESVETAAEADALAGLGVRLMQGYLFARPAFKALPTPTVPVGA